MNTQFITLKVSVVSYIDGYLDSLANCPNFEEFAVQNGKIYESFYGRPTFDHECFLQGNIISFEGAGTRVEYALSDRSLKRLHALLTATE